jgi:hypothetical protein
MHGATIRCLARPSQNSFKANFYEKALFVKSPTWRPVSVAEAQLLISALRAMLLSALSGSLLLLGGSVHRMRSVFSD